MKISGWVLNSKGCGLDRKGWVIFKLGGHKFSQAQGSTKPKYTTGLKLGGVSLLVLRPYAAHCIKLVCMAVLPEGSLF